MSSLQLGGIHHVTAICSDPQANIDFYTNVLGLRLVKLTVNFDDPSTYHLYYGDTVGTPGTILTFFAYKDMMRGYSGAGNYIGMTFAVPVGSLDFWHERLAEYHAEFVEGSFDERLVTARDPDGLTLRFVEREQLNPKVWPALGHTNSILRIDGVTLGSRTPASMQFAQQVLKAEPQAEKQLTSGNEIRRYRIGESYLDVLPTVQRNLGGPGTIHHVAWRVTDDKEQAIWHAHLRTGHMSVSDVRDRKYFHSIYFREPGGALNEIATDGPGFTADEPVDKLGSELKMPPTYAAKAAEIEAELPKLRLPQVPV